MKSKLGAVEKSIYVEERSGAFRFIVQVSPFPKTAAPSTPATTTPGLAGRNMSGPPSGTKNGLA